MPLIFAPGEAFQFDWSEDWAVVGGERTKLAVAQFKLCHSRMSIRLCGRWCAQREVYPLDPRAAQPYDE